MKKNVREYWSGKSILITGASSGLGRAVVEALAPYGLKMGLISRREEPMKELATALKDSPSRFWIKSCDVQDRPAVEAAVEAFQKWAGGIDVGWVNSGVGADSSLQNWDWQNVERTIDTNIKGAIYTAVACLNAMKDRDQGALVGIGSAASMRGLPARGVYSLTKIAVAYFWESLAAELPHLQFTVIHPGFVDTPINAGNPNRFWLMQPQKAAQLMIRAVARGKRVYIYPYRMKLLYRTVRALPQGVYHWLAQKLFNISRPPTKKIS